ncbi:hypothetical protein GDO81_023191, partial [Engystomops pustulosus]
SHTLRYYVIAASAPGSGLPEYSFSGYVDDQQIELYNSELRRNVPVAPWMKEKEEAEYWEGQTWFRKSDEAFLRHETKMWMKRFNHTGGSHFVQIMTGCELRDDGSIARSKRFTYDGEEFMYYDPSTGVFIPSKAEARITTQEWNMEGHGCTESTRQYMAAECIERLKRFIEFGREDLERKVRPRVKVSGRESGDVTKLHCVVYGFLPRAVDVRWMKNGVDDVPTYETTHVLPNPDGTYQIRVSVDVISKEVDTYLCYVDHSSLEEPLLVPWEKKSKSHLAVVAGVVIIIVLLLAAGGITLYRSKCPE